MPPPITLNPQMPCPCGNQKSLESCCLPFIEKKRSAPTAEALMRSRYTAHVLQAVDYLWDTWSPAQRGNTSKLDILSWAASCEWLGLQILATKAGKKNDQHGLVTFVALFKQKGTLQQHHEVSVFEKIDDHWLYVGHQQ